MEHTPSAAESEAFFEGAYGRMRRMMYVIAATAAPVLALAWGWRQGIGFALGAAVSILNFRWLEQGIAGLADRVTRSGPQRSATGIVLRLLLRYGLVAAVAYAIFKSLAGVMHGFLLGLFLPVAAMICEAGYEAWMAFRRGI